MKTLPDNPNLDHLRQQAKDLLAGLRDSDPAAKLSHAQASLAERYGFGSWTELKAEVDRRRGRADVADEALARAIAARYGLVVAGWDYAGGQPPSWELAGALADWAIDPDGNVNAAGARALVQGYRAQAGSVPDLNLAAFRGHAMSIVNYLDGLVYAATESSNVDDRHHADRSVRHLLAHLPSRTAYERLLDAAG